MLVVLVELVDVGWSCLRTNHLCNLVMQFWIICSDTLQYLIPFRWRYDHLDMLPMINVHMSHTCEIVRFGTAILQLTIFFMLKPREHYVNSNSPDYIGLDQS